MTTKEKIIHESMARNKKRIEKIKGIIYANPLSGIIKLRQKAHEIMIEHGKDYATIGRLIAPLGKEEKRLFRLAKSQQKTNDLISEQVGLEMECSDLAHELFCIELREKRGRLWSGSRLLQSWP